MDQPIQILCFVYILLAFNHGVKSASNAHADASVEVQFSACLYRQRDTILHVEVGLDSIGSVALVDSGVGAVSAADSVFDLRNCRFLWIFMHVLRGLCTRAPLKSSGLIFRA